ncbi:branched-chain amino acid transport system II carrier protein BrnQ5 [Bacillus sp. GX]|uniref:Branched-chain amino acid transport system carrier protein n=2 Tax=Bacillus cereus group TaxID=86661 RepID=A0A9X6WXA6_BACCE|nr:MULTISPECIES: branched-chain amino acid transport system II carrier protein [Bacillus]AXO99121.1 branched-chain amino acid transport system II carrier protein [Bacillus anthracis]MBU5217446.1 branched-chain amino acid transport system II carrier protein [Bacillus albus]MCI4058081.1 branched-chain amino acid transport system II carrier protein [Bacillus cereus]MDA2025731.1 branched-chain amino acid transport system II carrier protein [Bacillus cereus group sp. Bcc03]MDA2216491.1 branched-cha
MSNKVPTSFIIIIGLMLFALFFGAGNLIFPPMLGQMAGNNVWIANAGFLVTGVGLPLLAITAFVFSGESDLQSLASRVHPVFGIVFAIVLYLAIGPFYAIPRSGTVSFEIGIKPFLSNDAGPAALTVFTILFFTVTCLLSLNPTKLVDIVGKILTPIKLTVIGMLVVVAFIHPIGRIQAPSEVYASDAFFKGFQEGYLTLDALGAFVFGIIIVNAIREKGATTKKQLMVVCVKATTIAATLLALIYTALSYMGASSVEKLGHLNNGAEVLAKVSGYYFGSYGAIFLGVMIIVACLITSVGLITACSSFFHKLFPKISYKKLAIILSVFSTLVANIGLTQLIKISIPVLITMYPIAITLIFLTFLHSVFNGRFEVYQGSLILTFIFSSLDGLKAAGIESEIIHNFFEHFLPLYSVGLGWGFPAIIGGVCGYVVSVLRKKNTLSSSETQLNK